MNKDQIADRLLETLRVACDGTELGYSDLAMVLDDLKAEYDLLAAEEDAETTYTAAEPAMLHPDDR